MIILPSQFSVVRMWVQVTKFSTLSSANYTRHAPSQGLTTAGLFLRMSCSKVMQISFSSMMADRQGRILPQRRRTEHAHEVKLIKPFSHFDLLEAYK